MGDTFEVWADAFITGKKSTDTDWDAYVAEMKNLSIDQYLQMYNDNNKLNIDELILRRGHISGGYSHCFYF